jgi:flagellar hook-length control protein FliK
MKMSVSAGGGAVAGDETTARLSNLNNLVNITESDNINNGLMNFFGQQSKKTAKAEPSPKETESSDRIRRHQTLDQIIRQAAIHLRNDQHEAIIDLKSDILGHIRMQVICENQQVTVRILAEHGFVKDMIESNLDQLKADLQQQGLEVDKLEVAVSRDPDESGSSKEKLAQWRAGQGNADHRKNDDWKDRQQKGARHPPPTAINAATVDYFA